jgi:1-phosphofructokinase family hexose kinase
MPGRMVTVTLNAAVDRVIVVKRLRRGQPNIALRSPHFCGGKGVNVARALALVGMPVVATGFIGQSELALFNRALDRLGVQAQFVPIAGQTRTNYKLVEEETGEEIEINERGPAISDSERLALEAALDRLCESAGMFLFSGSLPKGLPHDDYAQLISRVQKRGVRCALDSSAEALRAGLRQNPYLVKINRFELGQVLGTELSAMADVGRGLEMLCTQGIGVAVASVGPDGAVASDGSATWFARPPVVDVRSAVGAGDVMLAGMAVSLLGGDCLDKALRWATALATASVTNYEPGAVDVGLAEQLIPKVELARL